MLVAGLFIFFTASLIPERPEGDLDFLDLLPSLIFIDPILLTKIIGIEVKSLDGAFWSLYVEVNFYILVAISFFVLKNKNLVLIFGLYVTWLLFQTTEHIITSTPYIRKLIEILNLIGVNYYGWFLLGITAYKYEMQKTKLNALLLGTLAIIAVLTTQFGKLSTTLIAAIISLIFILPLFFDKLKNILSNQLFVFFGFISYPLYLIHQNFVTGLAIKYHDINPKISPIFYPIPFILLVIFVALMIAKVEPYIRTRFKYIINIISDN